MKKELLLFNEKAEKFIATNECSISREKFIETSVGFWIPN